MTQAPEHQLREALRELMLAHRVLDPLTRPCGAPLSPEAAHALLDLLAAPEGLSVGELAARLSVDRSNVSRLCARLEDEGLVVRGVDPTDRRARRVTLTAAGLRAAEQVNASSLAHHRRLLELLGDTPHDITDALRRLSAAARAAGSPETP